MKQYEVHKKGPGRWDPSTVMSVHRDYLAAENARHNMARADMQRNPLLSLPQALMAYVIKEQVTI